MGIDETTDTLLQPVKRFAATCVAPVARKFEHDPTVLQPVVARADELGLRELANGGLIHNPDCDTDTLAQIIGCVGERDAVIAIHLFAGVIHGALQRQTAQKLIPAPIFPYEKCAFVMAVDTASTDGYLIRQSSGGRHELVTIDVSATATRRYMGFRGMTWFVPKSMSVQTIAENISPSAYLIFLGEISLLCQCVTLALLRATIRYVHAYAHERQTFGRAIVRWQAVSQKLAHMAISYERAKAFFDQVLRNLESVRAAWQSQQLICTVLDEIVEGAVQVMGGHGYLEDHPVAKWMRDAQVLKTMLREMGEAASYDACTHTDTDTARGTN